ncbi:MAG TPA: hypothetical protein VIP05_07755 [Burkholderiaceae bacterium]
MPLPLGEILLDREQCHARYSTLLDDLSAAYAQRPWPSERIDRIAERIHAVEVWMARLQRGERHAVPLDDELPDDDAMQPVPEG